MYYVTSPSCTFSNFTTLLKSSCFMNVVLCTICLPSLYICCAVTLTIILLWFANHVKKGKEYNTCSKVSDLLLAALLYILYRYYYYIAI